MTLADALKGQKVTIVSMDLTELGVNRLTALGLTPGVRVRVVDNSLKDASIIECRGARLALGRGLARFIVVK